MLAYVFTSCILAMGPCSSTPYSAYLGGPTYSFMYRALSPLEELDLMFLHPIFLDIGLYPNLTWPWIIL